jgi:N-acetylmuramoyl-L-alanine amidase
MRIIAFIFCISFFSLPVFCQKSKIIVVIDPGHGGADPGHLSSNKSLMAEKELNLIIAKKFGAYIEESLQNVKIIYTRTDDSFPSLNDRVEKANNIKADYFISIHCNANDCKEVHGTESHVHTMKSTKSVSLANEFEKEFTKKAGRHSRGVKDSDDREHSLKVLKYTNMSSVLVECGFLTNENEAKYLNSNNGQDVIASSIFRAFKTVIVKEHPSINFIKPVKVDPNQNAVATNNAAQGVETFAIQIMSSKSPTDTEAQEFKKIGIPVTRNELTTSSVFKYRYTVGAYASKDEAKKDLEKVQLSGFKDAYIINSKK